MGHSETLADDRDADHSWLAQGGTLRGQSAPRLAFLRRLLEEGPVPGMEPIQTWWGYRLAGKEHDYYLRYFGQDAPTDWAVVLPGKGADAVRRYRADIIDSWNMTITPAGTFTMAQLNAYDVHDPARPTIALPGRPWMAVRLVRV